jgi:uncharacterized membrane protein
VVFSTGSDCIIAKCYTVQHVVSPLFLAHNCTFMLYLELYGTFFVIGARKYFEVTLYLSLVTDG